MYPEKIQIYNWAFPVQWEAGKPFILLWVNIKYFLELFFQMIVTWYICETVRILSFYTVLIV
mgnify:CR=1 FL=1